jgi:tetratricopeptide (TPR) repeat protein
LCQLVEGLPLGVELAAAQLGAFSVVEIVTAVESNLGRLSAALQNLPPRHHSIRAVFEYSWSRLTLAEQQSLAQLSVFRGGFSAEAAEAVAGANWERLLALVNKSLVRFGQARRYELHELLRQFAAEKLAGSSPNLAEDTRDRHCAYYLCLVAQRAADLEGQTMHQALNELRPEMDNLRQAWHWALRQGHFELLKNSLTALQQFYLRLGFIREGETIFRQAAERVEAQPSEGLTLSVLLGQLMLARLAFLFPLLQYDHIIELAQTVIRLGQQAGDAKLVVIALEQWSHSLFLQGRYAPAQCQLEQAQAQAQAAGLRLLEAQILGRLGKTWIYQGETAPAQRCYEQALALYRQLGQQRGEMSVLHDLGELYYEQGDYEQSKVCVEQELAFQREMGAPTDLSAALSNLGDIYLRLGMYTPAKRCYTESLQVADRLESPYDACFALDSLGLVAHYQDDDAGALTYLSRALAIAEAGAPRIQGYILTHLGLILLARGELSGAAEVYQQAVALRQSLGQTHFAMESRAGLAKARLVQGDLAQAQAEVSEILAYLETPHSLEQVEEPALVYLICYEVLTTVQDQRAEELRQAARSLIQTRAAKLRDEALRRSYLENIPFHRVLAIEPFSL